jgi:hypothetical protein
MINFSRKVINKNFKQRVPRVEPYGTSDSREKGEENFPKIQTKEHLFDK